MRWPSASIHASHSLKQTSVLWLVESRCQAWKLRQVCNNLLMSQVLAGMHSPPEGPPLGRSNKLRRISSLLLVSLGRMQVSKTSLSDYVMSRIQGRVE